MGGRGGGRGVEVGRGHEGHGARGLLRRAGSCQSSRLPHASLMRGPSLAPGMLTTALRANPCMQVEPDGFTEEVVSKRRVLRSHLRKVYGGGR